MELQIALILYAIIVLTVFWLARYSGITMWSALVLSLLIGIIALSAMCPISSVERVFRGDPLFGFYALIQLTTTLIILWYILDKSLRDRDLGEVDEFVY